MASKETDETNRLTTSRYNFAMKAYLSLLILGSTWGLYFSLIKVVVESGISYWNILLLSSILVMVGLVIISLFRQKLPLFSTTSFRFYLVCSLLGYLVPFVLEIFAADNLPASILTLVATTTPLFTLCIAALLKTDTINRFRMIGIFFGLIAVCLILFPAGQTDLSISFFWASVAFGIPVAYALHENYVSKFWPKNTDAIQIACGEALLATVLMLPVSLFYAEPILILDAPASGIAAIFAIALIGLVDIYLYFELIRTTGPVFTSQASYITAFTGVLWSILIFDETPDIWIWGSAVFLIVGLFLINQGNGNRRRSHIDKVTD